LDSLSKGCCDLPNRISGSSEGKNYLSRAIPVFDQRRFELAAVPSRIHVSTGQVAGVALKSTAGMAGAFYALIA